MLTNLSLLLIFSDAWNLEKLLKVLKPIVSHDLSFNFIDFWKDSPKVQDPRITNNEQANGFNKNDDSSAEASNGYSLEQSNDISNIKNIRSHWEQRPKLCIIINIIEFSGKVKS